MPIEAEEKSRQIAHDLFQEIRSHAAFAERFIREGMAAQPLTRAHVGPLRS